MSAASNSPSHPCTLFIGSEPVIQAWTVWAKSVATVIPVSHTDVSHALEILGSRRPDVVVIEQAVAATGSGSTLMAHLHNERYERGIEVRLLPAHGANDLLSSEPGDMHPQAWLSALTDALPARPQRRAARVVARDAEQATVNGAPVTVLNVSAKGLQVRSDVVLRPQQRVRVVLPPDRGAAKTAAVVAWSKFEIGPTPHYRAGISFSRAIPTVVDDASPA